MDNNVIETLKFLMRDTRKLAEVVQELKAASQELTEETSSILERLEVLEENRPTGAVPVAATSMAASSPESSEIDRILDLPLDRVLDLYDETPQVLEPLCRRAALVEQDGTLILERNSQGNYWVLQLRDQGLYLLPRPGAFVRTTALESLGQLFELSGDRREDGSDEFQVAQPATLVLLRRHQRWQLEQRGTLRFGQTPLEYRWQQKLRQIEQDYSQIQTALDLDSQASLRAEVAVLGYQQRLHQRYGHPLRVFVNTCMPMAYALYRDPEDEQTQLVPCSVRLGSEPRVYPTWDAGVPWESSLFGQVHTTDKTDIRRSSAQDPRLPGQAYLADQTAQTWAIVASYEEASTLVDRLVGNWGTLSA